MLSRRKCKSCLGVMAVRGIIETVLIVCRIINALPLLWDRTRGANWGGYGGWGRGVLVGKSLILWLRTSQGVSFEVMGVMTSRQFDANIFIKRDKVFKTAWFDG